MTFGWVFSKNLSFKIVTIFQSYVTFILQWIAFIFGRNEEEDQWVFHMQERQLSLSLLFKKKKRPWYR